MEGDAGPRQRLLLALDGWAEAANVREAAAREYVDAAELTSLARAATGAEDREPYFTAAVREAMRRRLRRAVTKCKAPLGVALGCRCCPSGTCGAAAAGGGAYYWDVTCDALEARPFRAVQPQASAGGAARKDKKALKAARRAAAGKPERDPRASRAPGTENEGHVNHFTRYTDELLQLKCAPTLLELGLFPNAKELSESFACFAAARSHLSDVFDPSSERVLLVAVGDGVTPRTAALFAFRTRWRCVAVDPLMADADAWQSRVERLTAVRARVQDVEPYHGDSVLVVLVHAHVGLAACLSKVRWRRALAAVAIPCCNYYLDIGLPGVAPASESEDPGIVSPHRLVRVWRWTRDESGLPPDVPPPVA